MQSFLFLLCITLSVLRGRCFVLTRDASITDAVNLVRRPFNICGGRLLVRSEILLASSLSLSCSSKNDLLNVHMGNGTVRESSQRYFTFFHPLRPNSTTTWPPCIHMSYSELEAGQARLVESTTTNGEVKFKPMPNLLYRATLNQLIQFGSSHPWVELWQR